MILGETGEYDLFILYLGGHGRGHEPPFRFVFWGNNADSATAGANEIDSLVKLGNARTVLLLLDACYSGRYVEETQFFGADRSRICITSSKQDQKSWEDKRLRSSLFAHAIEEALRTYGSQPGGAERVATQMHVDIAKAVTSHAFALKRGIPQEPMLVGDAMASIVFPRADVARATRKPMTHFQVLVRRTRQIVATILSGALVGLLLLLVTTWRPAFNASGHVELRPGPKWLSLFNVGPFERRLELDLERGELNDASEQFYDEAGIYVWQGLGEANVARWADVFIGNFLNETTALRWQVRLGYQNLVERLTTVRPAGGGSGLRTISPSSSRTITNRIATRMAAEAKALDPAAAVSEVWHLQWKEMVALAKCNVNDSNPAPQEMAREMVDLAPSNEYVEWMDGLTLAAQAGENVGFDQVDALVKLFAAARATTPPSASAQVRPTRAEMSAIQRLSRAIARAHPQSISKRATELIRQCQHVAAPAVAALGHAGNIQEVIAWVHAHPDSEEARLALIELARYRVLPDAEIDWYLTHLGFLSASEQGKRSFEAARAWLLELSTVHPVPASVIGKLIDHAYERVALKDLQGATDTVEVIVSSPAATAPQHMVRIDSLIAAMARLRPLPFVEYEDEIEWLGLLARSGASLSAEQRARITNLFENNPKPEVYFSAQDIDPEAAAVVNLNAPTTSLHLLAFARFVTGAAKCQAFSPTVFASLKSTLSDALQAGVRRDIVRELGVASATVWLNTGQVSDGKSLRDQLRQAAGSALEVRTQIEISAAALLLMDKAHRETVLLELRQLWRTEREPATKLALAAVIVRAVNVEGLS